MGLKSLMPGAARNFSREFIDAFDVDLERPHLINGETGEILTYGAVKAMSLAAAGWLAQKKGITAGKALAISAENNPELAVLYFAAIHLGVRIVPLNPQLDAGDIRHIIGTNDPAVILLDDAQMTRLDDICPARLRDRAQSIEAVDFSHPAYEKPFSGLGDDKVFLTSYSSGTTARPKGMDVTWGAMLGNGRAYADRFGLDTNCRFYNTVPMTYMGGFYNMTVLPTLIGGSVVIDPIFGPANIFGYWNRVKERGVNILWFTSAMLSMLLEADRGDDLDFLHDQIRFAFCGFAPLPPDLKDRFETRFGFTLYENYASSECLFIAVNQPGLIYKPGSKGRPLKDVTITITGPDNVPLQHGNEGQILVKTPHFMAGYRNAEATDETNITGAGFLTGDTGLIDDNGELFVTGRIKDLIIRGGINISPASIEDVLATHDAVDQVAVVGLPDPVYGEKIIAVVTLIGNRQAEPKEMKKFCKGKIGPHKIPSKVVIVDVLPRGATGKIDKDAVRAMLA